MLSLTRVIDEHHVSFSDYLELQTDSFLNPQFCLHVSLYGCVQTNRRVPGAWM